jgi:hypothetical protein
MRGDCVSLLSCSTGRTLQTVFLSHMLTSAASASSRYAGAVAEDSRLLAYEADMEGRGCHVHWCAYTQLLVVGFSTGLVGVTSFHQPILSSTAVDCTYIRSNEVHSSAITLLKTFVFTHHTSASSSGGKRQELVVLLVGDASGVLSLWQFHPTK